MALFTGTKSLAAAVGLSTVVVGGGLLSAAPAHADGLDYQVTNYDGDDGTSGVYLRNSANVDDRTGTLLGYGTNVRLSCYTTGSSVGANGNAWWDQVTVLDGPYAGATGYLSDHWINTSTPGPQNGEPACGGGSGSSGYAQGAINYARGYLGTSERSGECLGFTMDAYSAAGLDIGGADSAVDYWSANPKGYASGTDANPPVGALVFWGATGSNPYGHVGIYEGSDTVISTSSWPEGDGTAVHEFSLSGRNDAGYPYLGWINPS